MKNKFLLLCILLYMSSASGMDDKKHLATDFYEDKPAEFFQGIASLPAELQFFILNKKSPVEFFKVEKKFDHLQMVRCAEFSPDEKLLATGCDDREVRIFDLEEQKSIKQLSHSNLILSAKFQPKGNLLATLCDDDTTVRIFNTTDWKIKKTFKSDICARALAFCPNGKFFAMARELGTLHIFDASKNFEYIVGLPFNGSSLAFSANSGLLAVGSIYSDAYIVNTDTWETLQTLSHGGTVMSVALSSIGNLFATGCKDGKIRVFDTDKWQNILTHGDDWAGTLEFSPDGRLLVAGSKKGVTRIFNAKTLACLQELCPEGWVASAKFSANGKLLAVACRRGAARIFKKYMLQQNWAEYFLLHRICQRINCAKFSHDINSVEDMFNEGLDIISPDDLDTWCSFSQEDQSLLWNRWLCAIKTYQK